MWQEKISKHTLSSGKFTAMGTANIIGKDKGTVMAA
jgi:hypothetical protein